MGHAHCALCSGVVINRVHRHILRKGTCTLRKPGQSADQHVRPLEPLPTSGDAFRARTRRFEDTSSVASRTERAACSSVPAAQAQHLEACCTSAPLQRPLSAQPSEPSNKQLLFSGVKRCNPVPAAHQANCAALPKGGAMESRMAQSLRSCSGRPPCSAHQPPVYRILMLSRSRRRRQFLPTTAVVTL